MERKELLKSSIEFSNLLGIETFSCSRLQNSINFITENHDDFKTLKLNYIIKDINTEEDVLFPIKSFSFEEDTDMISLNWENETQNEQFCLEHLISFIDSIRLHHPDNWGNFMLNCQNLFVVNFIFIQDDKLCFSFKTLDFEGESL